MVLNKRGILKAVNKGEIQISPFNADNVGPNSVDVTLSDEVYAVVYNHRREYDSAQSVKWMRMAWDENDSMLLLPGRLYLGRTMESVGSDKYLPKLEGRSSTGRLGMFVHITAGSGDLGFNGTWTLEIVSVMPLRIYRGVRIGQMLFHKVAGAKLKAHELYDSQYQGQSGVRPSGMWREVQRLRESKVDA